VRCTAPALMPHSGDDETSRRGAVPGKDAVKRRGRGGAKLSCAARGWARGQRWRGQRRVVREEDDEAADRWGRSASERERARESGWQVGSARQREREGAIGAAARAGAGRHWADGGGARAQGGERRPRHGLNPAQQGGQEGFLFFFLFSNSYFHFCIFFF
jgi:hypothetical protein